MLPNVVRAVVSKLSLLVPYRVVRCVQSLSLSFHYTQVWADTPVVANVLLKFLAELVFNRGMRVSFGNCSANGILLFRETSAMCSAFGRRMAHFTPVCVLCDI